LSIADWNGERSKSERGGHLVLLGLCTSLSFLAIMANALFLSFAWDDVLLSMRAVWITYALLLIVTASFAWHESLSGRRSLRGALINFAVLFGFPALVFVSADLLSGV
jgi:hypothetical protein